MDLHLYVMYTQLSHNVRAQIYPGVYRKDYLGHSLGRYMIHRL